MQKSLAGKRKARAKRVAEEKKITTEDCLAIGVLRVNREIKCLDEKIF